MANLELEFDNIDELKQYLSYYFNKVDKLCECNVFLHHYNDRGRDFGENMDSVINRKILSTLKRGLRISRYSSLSGRANLVGTTSNVDMDSVVNYRYYYDLSHNAICVILIPKYIQVAGESVEFSSYNNQTAHQRPRALMDEYQKFNCTPDVHHCKCSLFDAIKGFDELPKEYILGIIQLDDKIKFIPNNTHFCNQTQQYITNHNNLISQRIEQLYQKFNTKKLEQIIALSYKDEQNLREIQDACDF